MKQTSLKQTSLRQTSLKHILSFALAMLIAVTALFTSTGCSDKSKNTSDDNQTTENLQKNSDEGEKTGESTGATSDNADESGTEEGGQSEATDIGEGETVFRFEATDDKGNVTAWNVHTDEKTVEAALLAVELIEGDESEFGLFVKKVNGIEADFEKDKAYWAFYIDGEYSVDAGAGTTDVKQDGVYAFIYTKD